MMHEQEENGDIEKRNCQNTCSWYLIINTILFKLKLKIIMLRKQPTWRMYEAGQKLVCLQPHQLGDQLSTLV